MFLVIIFSYTKTSLVIKMQILWGVSWLDRANLQLSCACHTPTLPDSVPGPHIDLGSRLASDDVNFRMSL